MPQFPITYQVDIYHLVLSGDKESYEATPSYTAVKTNIQPAGADILAVNPGLPSFSTYQCFIFDSVTIKNGDKLVGEGETFIVRGVSQIFNHPSKYYQEMVLEKVVGT